MKIAFTCGDLNGIGLEIFYKYFFHNEDFESTYTIFCNSKSLRDYFDKLKYKYKIEDNILKIKKSKIFIEECENEVEINFGETQKDAGMLAVESIEKASFYTAKGDYDFLVTIPIQKQSTYLAGWKYPGHTEYFNEFYKKHYTQMMLFSGSFRVVPVTVHIPLKDVSKNITEELILHNIKQINRSIRTNFGIKKPKIAVLGLNPHCGENGSFGDEEIKFISPAIEKARELDINVKGPFAADGFFGFGDFVNYDGILSMYHDQGLIPLKLYAYGGGVNFTTGLSIVRTSPDHGTAMDIAGKNIANIKSISEAIESGKLIFANRKKYMKLNKEK